MGCDGGDVRPGYIGGGLGKGWRRGMRRGQGV